MESKYIEEIKSQIWKEKPYVLSLQFCDNGWGVDSVLYIFYYKEQPLPKQPETYKIGETHGYTGVTKNEAYKNWFKSVGIDYDKWVKEKEKLKEFSKSIEGLSFEEQISKFNEYLEQEREYRKSEQVLDAMSSWVNVEKRDKRDKDYSITFMEENLSLEEWSKEIKSGTEKGVAFRDAVLQKTIDLLQRSKSK